MLQRCFPFDPASPALRPLQLAIPATPELILDFKKATQDGEKKKVSEKTLKIQQGKMDIRTLASVLMSVVYCLYLSS